MFYTPSEECLYTIYFILLIYGTRRFLMEYLNAHFNAEIFTVNLRSNSILLITEIFNMHARML